MPVYDLPSSRKSNGFSIDDIIKSDYSPRSSKQAFSSAYLPPLTWFPSSSKIYQFHHQSMLQYLRHTNPLSSFLHSYRKPKRHRTAFTPTQLLKLENEFEKSHYIVGQERKDLAKHLNLPEARIKVWYQNRRTKHKRSINEDGNSSMNEIDHQNESETSEIMIKMDS